MTISQSTLRCFDQKPAVLSVVLYSCQNCPSTFLDSVFNEILSPSNDDSGHTRDKPTRPNTVKQHNHHLKYSKCIADLDRRLGLTLKPIFLRKR